MDKNNEQNKNINFKSSGNEIKIESSTNKMYIVGCIATIDEASEGSPCGADGKRIVLSGKDTDKCIESFKGQPMNCIFENWDCIPDIFTGHGDKYWGMHFGFIEDAWQDGKKLMAKIVVWKDTFPELAFTILNAQRSLGFSIEIYPTKSHEDENENIVIDEWEAFGCALLWRNCAAFGEETYIEKLAASLQKGKDEKESKGDAHMTKEEIQSIVASVSAGVTEEVKKIVDEKIAGLGIEDIKASIEDMKQSKSVKEPVNDNDTTSKPIEANKQEENTMEEIKNIIKAELDGLKKELEASKDIPKPKSYTGNTDLGTDNDYIKSLEKIDASDMSISEKLKAKARIQFAAEKNGVKFDEIYRPITLG